MQINKGPQRPFFCFSGLNYGVSKLWGGMRNLPAKMLITAILRNSLCTVAGNLDQVLPIHETNHIYVINNCNAWV